ncbi:MAG: nitrate reductase molybdenum cofactor assembly chaperone [Pseudomonadales bacterium]|nr:nitrate reductase molybdenum cofactor assembly chaperone [Pseudomonadales bacterium]
MDILKVIARLLDYPREEVYLHKGELALLISDSVEISPDHRSQLLTTLDDIYQGDLMDSEERYTGLFEQGRSLSLHLFEHVHGESRDRGQAMVDLMAEYTSHGFEIESRELPDYIPMFLEYLSYQSDLDAREWLADVSHILALLGARLKERQSPYANLFESLLLIAGRSEALEAKLKEIGDEVPDNTMEAIDKEWEEVAVTFGAEDQACDSSITSSNPDEPQPLRWKEASASDILNQTYRGAV